MNIALAMVFQTWLLQSEPNIYQEKIDRVAQINGHSVDFGFSRAQRKKQQQPEYYCSSYTMTDWIIIVDNLNQSCVNRKISLFAHTKVKIATAGEKALDWVLILTRILNGGIEMLWWIRDIFIADSQNIRCANFICTRHGCDHVLHPFSHFWHTLLPQIIRQTLAVVLRLKQPPNRSKSWKPENDRGKQWFSTSPKKKSHPRKATFDRFGDLCASCNEKHQRG